MRARAANEALHKSLTEEELAMTVEEYLKAQCDRRVAHLKRHMESLVDSFEEEAKKARKVLRDIGANAGAETADAADAQLNATRTSRGQATTNPSGPKQDEQRTEEDRC